MTAGRTSVPSRGSRRISVIIPSWNAKDLLRRCISSIVRNTQRYEVEIIVVDNGSTDGLLDMVRTEFTDAITMENGRNLGFGRACNIGMQRATGEYYAMVNSDIVLGHNCLDDLCDYLDADHDVGLIGPKVLYPDGSLQQTTREFPTLWNSYCRALALDTLLPRSRLLAKQFMSYWKHDHVMQVDFLSGCLLVTRAETVLRTGGFDERYFIFAEDKDWARRFWDLGYKVVYYPDATAIHHHYASASRDPTRFYVEEIRSNLKYWRKHHGKWQQRLYSGSVLLHQSVRIVSSVALYMFWRSYRPQATAHLRRSVRAIRCLFAGNRDSHEV